MAKPIPDEQAALLAAIVAQPEEDTPRLVYADWLQEHGDEEQAQFIRDSIMFAGMSEDADGREPLRNRLRDLSRAKGEGWVAALGVEVDGEIAFDRGLPSYLSYYGRLDFFLEQAEAVLSLVPVRELLFHWDGWDESDENLRALAALPGLARLRDLTLMSCGELPVGGWGALIHSPHLRGLQYLGAIMCGLHDKHAQALAGCPNLTGLTVLDLPDNRFSVAAMLAIVRSPHLANVTALSFADNESREDDWGDDEWELEKPDRERYRELAGALTARFGNADALTTWLR